MIRVTALALLLVGCRGPQPQHRYTCAEIFGPHPKPGRLAIFPPGYSTRMPLNLGGGEAVPDFRVWDERGELVCDVMGRDVK